MISKLPSHEVLASRHCQRCRHPFMSTHRLLYCCPPCAQIQHEEREQQQKEEGVRIEADRRRRRWEEFCPALYRESDPARLPSALLTAVADYRHGARGLGFVGESGLGKTRAMMRLCGRFILEEDRRGEYVTGTAFSREVAERGHEVGAYTKRLRQADFLFLDDVGKGKLTEAVQAHLHDVLEERTAHLRPTLWTSNAGGVDLAAMFTADRAEPFLRRLASLEFSTIIRL